MAASKGVLVYNIYKAFSYALSPLLRLHIQLRKLRGLEHPSRWPERLGRPSLPRPPGPLLWFHAVSLGEGMAAIPVIKRCVQCRPGWNILMTTTTMSAFEVIKNQLPHDVLYQISLVLLNARMSARSFRWWSGLLLFPLISLMLSKFSLIVPLSNVQAIRFQLLQAPPFIINFAGDLKYAVGYDLSKEESKSIDDLKVHLAHRHVWMASSIHRGEEEVILGVHNVLVQTYPDLLTIIAPRYPKHGQVLAQVLQKQGHNVALRSQHRRVAPGENIYVVDTLGELTQLYRLTPIAVIGGSFFPDLAGHNMSEPAAACCAIITGYNVGHFSHMVQEMQQLNPLSVLQVSGKSDLQEALEELFSDAKVLEARRLAAEQAFHALSSDVITNVWNLLKFRVCRQDLSEVYEYWKTTK